MTRTVDEIYNVMSVHHAFDVPRGTIPTVLERSYMIHVKPKIEIHRPNEMGKQR